MINKKSLIIVFSLLLTVLCSNFVSAAGNVLGVYQRNSSLIDFMLFFTLFMALSWIALRNIYKDKEQRKPVMSIAIVVGLALAIGAVMAGFSASFLGPYIKYVLVCLATILLYLFLITIFKVESLWAKFLLFLLSALIVLIIFMLGNGIWGGGTSEVDGAWNKIKFAFKDFFDWIFSPFGIGKTDDVTEAGDFSSGGIFDWTKKDRGKCTSNADCSGGQVCKGGKCVSEDGVPSDGVKTGETCKAGFSVGTGSSGSCTSDVGCREDWTCLSGSPDKVFQAGSDSYCSDSGFCCYDGWHYEADCDDCQRPSGIDPPNTIDAWCGGGSVAESEAPKEGPKTDTEEPKEGPKTDVEGPIICDDFQPHGGWYYLVPGANERVIEYLSDDSPTGGIKSSKDGRLVKFIITSFEIKQGQASFEGKEYNKYILDKEEVVCTDIATVFSCPDYRYLVLVDQKADWEDKKYVCEYHSKEEKEEEDTEEEAKVEEKEVDEDSLDEGFGVDPDEDKVPDFQKGEPADDLFGVSSITGKIGGSLLGIVGIGLVLLFMFVFGTRKKRKEATENLPQTVEKTKELISEKDHEAMIEYLDEWSKLGK